MTDHSATNQLYAVMDFSYFVLPSGVISHPTRD